MTARVPVHVITGFLGSGKTTLLNEILRDPEFSKTAIIINEFGETGLDHLFIEGRQDGIVELSNGCLCCTIRGELAATLDTLPREGIDRVIVETTGLADPAPVLQAVIASPAVAARYEAATLVTLADALNFPRQFERQDEARRQAALADIVMVTKLDMVPVEERGRRLAEMTAQIRALNPAAPVIDRAGAPLSPALFELGGASPARVHSHEPGHHHHHHHDVNRHGDSIRSLVLSVDRPIPRQAVEMFCELMTSAHAEHLLRLKGLVAVNGATGPLLLHAIHGIMHEPRQLDAWPGGIEGTRIVVILDGLDPDFVRRLFAGFANLPMPDTPDRAALMENPLAIPGYRA